MEQRWWKIEDLVNNNVPTLPIKLPQLLLNLEEKEFAQGPKEIDFY